MKPIFIPQKNKHDYWDGTTNVRCHCGGDIEWAEAAFAPGARACRSCLSLFSVKGQGSERRLHPQGVGDGGIIGDVADDGEVYKVPEDLYPGWLEPIKENR